MLTKWLFADNLCANQIINIAQFWYYQFVTLYCLTLQHVA